MSEPKASDQIGLVGALVRLRDVTAELAELLKSARLETEAEMYSRMLNDKPAQPVRDLPKVRELIHKLREWKSDGFKSWKACDDAIAAAEAELDAQPKAVEVPVEAIKNLCKQAWGRGSEIDTIDRWLAQAEK